MVFRNATDTTIYNSIELGSVNRNVKKLEGNKYVFGYIGRLDKEKGIEFLLDTIKESGNDIRLLIAGAGDEDYVELLKNKSDAMDVHFLGKVAPAHFFFESVDFTIVPSLWYEPIEACCN
jgi:glycosyltransferase involved in cell wall biosynthesis